MIMSYAMEYQDRRIAAEAAADARAAFMRRTYGHLALAVPRFLVPPCHSVDRWFLGPRRYPSRYLLRHGDGPLVLRRHGGIGVRLHSLRHVQRPAPLSHRPTRRRGTGPIRIDRAIVLVHSA